MRLKTKIAALILTAFLCFGVALHADWLQTDWTGGEDPEATALAPNDELGWDIFQSADVSINISTPGSITMDTGTTWTETAMDGDFDNGTFENIWLSPNGELTLTGDATGTLGPAYPIGYNTTSVNNQSTADPFLFYDESSGQYRMYYSFYDGTNWSIVVRISLNGKNNWGPATSISLDDDNNTATTLNIRTPFVLYFSNLGLYRMYVSVFENGAWTLRNASSVNGTTSYSTLALLGFGVDAQDMAYCPFLYPIPDGGFRLYYSRYYMNFWQICYVTSLNSDGQTGWDTPTLAGIGRNFTYQAQTFSLYELDSGIFRLYFEWFNFATYLIGYTDSTDGMDGWTQPPVELARSTSFTQPSKPFLFRYPDNTFRLFFTQFTTSSENLNQSSYEIYYRDQEPGPPYSTSGEYESSTYDLGQDSEYSKIFWESTDPASTNVKCQIASSTSYTGPFTFLGPDGETDSYYTYSNFPIWSGHNGNRYIRYKMFLTTEDTNVTPTISLVKLTTIRSLVSSPFNSKINKVRYTRLAWTEVIPEVILNSEWVYDFNESSEYEFSDPTYSAVTYGTASLVPVNEMVSPSDDFQGETMNTRKWIIENLPGASVVQAAGVLTQTIDLTADLSSVNAGAINTATAVAQLVHSGVFESDFDVQVDFNVTSSPTNFWAGIEVTVPNTEPLLYGHARMTRYNGTVTNGTTTSTGSLYVGSAFNGLAWNNYPALGPDPQGTLRVVRNSSSVVGYARNQNTQQWEVVMFQPMPSGDAIVRLSCVAAQGTTGQTCSVQWDNFVVNSGTVDYREFTPVAQTITSSPINPSNMVEIVSFTADADIPDNTTLKYQLSNDAGASWRWWDGTQWAVAENVNQFNDETTINSQISNLDTDSDGIMVRLQLRSLDRWNTPVLDGLTIGYTYTKPASIGLQLRTSPDNGGIPGEWSEWLGPTSDGDYYLSEGGEEQINTSHSDASSDQWVQYRAFFIGENAFSMPILEEVLIRYGLYPSTPSLVSPSNGAVDTSSSPALTWEPSSGASPITYTVEIDETSDFLTPFIQKTGIGTIPYYPNLYANTTYYWRVKAQNSSGDSLWSDTWSFTTVATGELPIAPTLSTPSNGSESVVLPITFSWFDTFGTAPITYRVQVADNISFSNPQYDQSNINSNSYTISTLTGSSAEDVVFYWRVMAVNPYGQSTWSGTRTFALEYDVATIFPDTTRQTEAKCFLQSAGSSGLPFMLAAAACCVALIFPRRKS